ncbi:MAG: hypothetical protein FJ297_08735 [Planctomycetes bacterium]|nr:hypothetical protein [Planctomycetota bacterium]
MAHSRHALLPFLSWLFIHGAALAQEAGEAKAHPQAKLETAIPAAIKVLENKDYVLFLKTFAGKDDRKFIMENGGFESFAMEWGESKAGILLNVLKSIQDQEPEMRKEGAEAVYKIPESVKSLGKKKVVVFARVDNLWYLSD